jgi:hypothetical protein
MMDIPSNVSFNLLIIVHMSEYRIRLHNLNATFPGGTQRPQAIVPSCMVLSFFYRSLVQDDVDNGLPTHTIYEKKVAAKALDMPDLPLSTFSSHHLCYFE